jgi:GNAT superfamily N-acetyltransferase
MVGYAVRNLCDNDLTSTADIWFRSWHAAFPDLSHPMPYEAWLPRLRAEIAPRCACRVATLGPTITGFIAVDVGLGSLEQIFVDPAHQRHGVGEMLIDVAKELCPSGLTLTTLQRNTKAAAFYLRQGFLPGAVGINPVNGLPNIEYVWRPYAGDRWP